MITPPKILSDRIDWSDIRHRLERAMAASASMLELDPRRANAVMQQRARSLARAPEPIRNATELHELVTFVLANESYGIETRYVREVGRLTDVTAVPGTPDFLTGITSLRGEILAVVDLRKFFGVAAAGLSDLSRLVVLGSDRAEFGVLADAMTGVVTLPSDQLLEPPHAVSGVAREYLRGVTGSALIVLDGAVLLNDARLFIDQTQEMGD